MDLQLLSIICGFFGGGVFGALINRYLAERTEKKERKIKFLEDQIRNLYGPLYYFISQSEKLFELNKRMMDAYDIEYIEKKLLAPDEHSTETINIANRYIDDVVNNNLKIKEILNDNYSFIDPNDIELSLLFYEHYIRNATEIDEKKKLQTPLEIYKHMGNISFLRPEVIQGIKRKFLSKKQELDILLRQ